MNFYKDISEILFLLGREWEEPFYISSKQLIKKLPKESFKTDYFTVVICFEGNVVFEANEQEESLKAGDIFTAPPTTVISFKEYSENLKVSSLFFTKSFLLKHFSDSNLIFDFVYFKNLGYTIFNTTPEEKEVVLNYFDFLKKRTKKETPYRIEIIKSVIFTLLFEVAEIYLRQNKQIKLISKREGDIYFKFKRLIELYLPENKQVSFYADKLKVDPKYLITLLKKYHHKNPKELIDAKLAEKATLLLANSSLNINQISNYLHFSSTASFTRFFKRIKGVSPSVYQKGLLK